MPGLLVYIMGPSGAGKDSLIDAARPALANAGVQVARRVITRSAESVGEQALGVSHADFQQRLKAGEFALDWRANGLDYGISVDINQPLGAGRSVLVNGSRAYLEEALERYPHVLPILVTVDSAILRERLMRRGRETLEDIEKRLARSMAIPMQYTVAGVKVERVDNSADLQSAVQSLLQILQHYGVVI
ncbi:phosphonate metabolism protein/1,5-bisphosphokinase (PRPP-forming) PhnN [Pseudomonas sp. dw_358]|uniref:phosphonate metabolism protein/1,5-bisphosphokinase (PRPP-forming) PhnN n=1 Tax=Pseudomonas sp. dw_358 TaxID=2720083 RepID=UPI001BD3D8AD|nr:phosphonate metabolism protein/1,5-bisphosphokinase (PRPP-forming) PhnN [Pseudomonas sp. dw_358]